MWTRRRPLTSYYTTDRTIKLSLTIMIFEMELKYNLINIKHIHKTKLTKRLLSQFQYFLFNFLVGLIEKKVSRSCLHFDKSIYIYIYIRFNCIFNPQKHDCATLVPHIFLAILGAYSFPLYNLVVPIQFSTNLH